MVKIKEVRSRQLDDFTVENEDVYRVLDLIDLPDAEGVLRPTYRVRIIQADKEGKPDKILEEYVPKMNGKPLDHIPFDFIGPDDIEADVDAPPFVDMVDVNFCHFIQLSAYLHGCFYSGIPQAWLAGWELKPGEKLRIGGSAWVTPNPSAKADMLEVGSSGFIALKDVLKMLEDTMVVIGSRLPEVQKPGGTEGPVTSELHFSGEHSVLAGIGQSISAGATRRLKDFVDWAGGDSSEVSITLTKHFFDIPLSPQARDSIVKTWQAGLMSDVAAFNLLKNGGDYPASTTFEQEEADKKNGTGLPPQPAPPAPSQTKIVKMPDGSMVATKVN